ncbi:sporozoite surface protein 2 [Nematostella vectensis]|uniref:sporozoite surface protein 2 n=1 Tax=Nematostella vectensis TaxID=45351 RepID=UPI0013905F23|nr:sporozoite surface protein 2 [Nematostella vectensis]
MAMSSDRIKEIEEFCNLRRRPSKRKTTKRPFKIVRTWRTSDSTGPAETVKDDESSSVIAPGSQTKSPLAPKAPLSGNVHLPPTSPSSACPSTPQPKLPGSASKIPLPSYTNSPMDEQANQPSSPINEQANQLSSPINEQVPHLISPLNERVHHPSSPLNEQVHHLSSPLNEQVHHLSSPLNEQVHHPSSPLNEQVHHSSSPLNEQVHHPSSPLNEEVHHSSSPLNEQVHHPSSPLNEQVRHPSSPLNEQVHHLSSPLNEQVHHPSFPLNEQVPHQFSPLNEQVHHPSSPLNEQVHHPSSPLNEQVHHPSSSLNEQVHHPSSSIDMQAECLSPIFQAEKRYSVLQDTVTQKKRTDGNMTDKQSPSNHPSAQAMPSTAKSTSVQNMSDFSESARQHLISDFSQSERPNITSDFSEIASSTVQNSPSNTQDSILISQDSSVIADQHERSTQKINQLGNKRRLQGFKRHHEEKSADKILVRLYNADQGRKVAISDISELDVALTHIERQCLEHREEVESSFSRQAIKDHFIHIRKELSEAIDQVKEYNKLKYADSEVNRKVEKMKREIAAVQQKRARTRDELQAAKKNGNKHKMMSNDLTVVSTFLYNLEYLKSAEDNVLSLAPKDVHPTRDLPGLLCSTQSVLSAVAGLENVNDSLEVWLAQ